MKLWLECLAAVVFMVCLAVLYFYMVGLRIENQSKAAEKEKEELTKTLTAMTKEDYDFLVANGAEFDQAVHDHFYPKPVRQTHKAIAGDTYDPSMLQWKSWIETETIGGGNPFRLRKSQTEWNIK